MPNCTIIKTGATIASGTSSRVDSLKKLIDSMEVPYNAHYAGDIVFYNNVSQKLEIVSPEEGLAEIYPPEQYTPIGVVAVPNTHDLYGGHRCGVVSLKYMSYSTPDEGSTSTQNIYWGYNGQLLGDAVGSCVQTGTCASPTSEATGTTSSAYMPSDNLSGMVCPTDPEAHYYNSSSFYNAAPSPYLEDGSRNPVYYQTSDPLSEANCLADFDGVGKTQLMLDNVTVENWQTAQTVNNSYSSGNYPSACCCWRYHTDGTSQGDWYLPAMGELGYVIARLKTLNATISTLLETYGSDIGAALPTSSYIWSSSESSSANARLVYINFGTVYGINKASNGYVRAFLRV